MATAVSMQWPGIRQIQACLPLLATTAGSECKSAGSKTIIRVKDLLTSVLDGLTRFRPMMLTHHLATDGRCRITAIHQQVLCDQHLWGKAIYRHEVVDFSTFVVAGSGAMAARAKMQLLAFQVWRHIDWLRQHPWFGVIQQQ